MYNLIVVDDEPLILESLYKMVERERGGKFYVHKASSAKERSEERRVGKECRSRCQRGLGNL